MWSDDRDVIMKLLEDNHERYPRECPCCGKKAGHVFFYKRGNDRFGSAWAWCSVCQEYSHSRFEVPSWWQNYSSIDLVELHGCPDNLDEDNKSIDEWVNTLLRKREGTI